MSCIGTFYYRNLHLRLGRENSGILQLANLNAISIPDPESLGFLSVVGPLERLWNNQGNGSAPGFLAQNNGNELKGKDENHPSIHCSLRDTSPPSVNQSACAKLQLKLLCTFSLLVPDLSWIENRKSGRSLRIRVVSPIECIKFLKRSSSWAPTVQLTPLFLSFSFFLSFNNVYVHPPKFPCVTKF